MVEGDRDYSAEALIESLRARLAALKAAAGPEAAALAADCEDALAEVQRQLDAIALENQSSGKPRGSIPR